MKNYACLNEKSRGRLIKEEKCLLRSEFHRDRDRIIHSTAFRRLEYKTQVFVNHEGDHYRTRLTHTLEVACIARHIARILGVNEDLTETIALSHDLGHPPFGHAGEKALNNEMKNYGGFSHNFQTFKIITDLERKYAAFDGLNLTWESLEGILKHNGPISLEIVPDFIKKFNNMFDLQIMTYSSLEAQIAAIADDIAYNNHDIEDGVRASLFTIEDLKQIEYLKKHITLIQNKYPNLELDKLIHELKRLLINEMLKNVVDNASNNIKKHNINTINDVRQCQNQLIEFTGYIEEYHLEIKKFLMTKMYNHDYIKQMTNKAEEITSKLFKFYVNDYKRLPLSWQKRLENYSIQNVTCDYIAGMTDRFAIQQYKNLN